jgi:hypothetical protein
MPFRTGHTYIDGSINVDGSIFVFNTPFAAPTTNVYTTTVNYSIPTAYMNSIFEVSSASARSIYVPAGSVTGDQIAIINIGTGIVTISPSTGSGAPTLKGLGTRLKSRWSAASAYYNNTYNNWTLIGDVST